MKNILLKAVCIAAIALPFATQTAQAGTVTANLSDVTNSNTANYPTVKITLSDDGQPTGTVKVKVEVVPGPTGGIGDLRGVFFNLPSGVTGASITPVGGGPITATTGVTGSFGSIGNSANLTGSGANFGVGLEVGSQGISGNPPDDFRTTEFTVSGNGLTLAGFARTQFGTRMMSVSTSANGSRSESSKTLGNGGTVVTTTPSPSPSTAPSPSPSPSTAPSPSPSTPSGGGSPSPSPSTAPSPSPSTPSGGGTPAPSPSTPSGGGGDSNPPSVPEPIAILGLGLGLGGILLSRRQKNNK